MARALHRVSERAWENLGLLFGGVAVATIGHQVIHEWRTPGPSSVSIWFVVGFLGIYLFWFLYGLRFRRRGIWLPNALAAILYTVFALVLLWKM
jgi:uncharacterized protein with PQ loop repeat